MLTLRLLTGFWLLFGTCVSSIADDIVKNRDVNEGLKITGGFEVADNLIDHLCEEFPELRPQSEEEMFEFKSQSGAILYEMDHFLEMSADELDTVIAEHYSLPRHSLVTVKIKQLRMLARRKFARLAEAEQLEYQHEVGFILYHLEEPVRQLLEAKLTSYKERDLKQEQINHEINRREFAYAERWVSDSPIMQLFKADVIEHEDHAIPFGRVEEAQLIMRDYTSVHESIDYTVNHLVTKYPELHPGNEDKLIVLKRELAAFWTKHTWLKERLEILPIVQRSTVPEYPTFSVFLNKVLQIGKSLRPLGKSEAQLREQNEGDFYAISKMVLPPFLKHLDEKRAFYKKAGMGERLTMKHIGHSAMRLINAWHADDPENELLEASRESVREKYEL